MTEHLNLTELLKPKPELHVIPSADPELSKVRYYDRLEKMPAVTRFLQQTYNRFIPPNFWEDFIAGTEDEYREMIANIVAIYQQYHSLTSRQLGALEQTARKQKKVVPWQVYLDVQP